MATLDARRPRGGTDLRDRCGRLEITARSEDEQRWLAALYRTMTGGGWLTIAPNGEPDAERIEFRGCPFEAVDG
jgi:hypothetical protein